MTHSKLTRRGLLALTTGAALVNSRDLYAQNGRGSFEQWVDSFQPRARSRGISDATYNSVMRGLKPDLTVLTQQRNQAEFRDPLWKYLNRRVSAWRVEFGKTKARETSALFERIESAYGVDRAVLLGIWGNESAFGELVGDTRYMRPVIPSLAALAYAEPRRRAYWEQELINALVIVDRGWAQPREMIGSWAGAMGHTQWMPEVWLRIGVDFDRDGRVNPFGRPDDALAGSARYLIQRGRYRRGEPWGGEVELPAQLASTQGEVAARTVAQWRDAGVRPLHPALDANRAMLAKLWVPIQNGPAFLVGQNFQAVKSYNPSSSYALAVVLLGDGVMGRPPINRNFPGGERALTIAETKEIQTRISKLYEPVRPDGRISKETIAALKDFQRKHGLAPPDGYTSLATLNKLREVTR